MDLLCCVVMHTLMVNFFKNKRLHSILHIISLVCDTQCVSVWVCVSFHQGNYSYLWRKNSKEFFLPNNPFPLNFFYSELRSLSLQPRMWNKLTFALLLPQMTGRHCYLSLITKWYNILQAWVIWLFKKKL